MTEFVMSIIEAALNLVRAQSEEEQLEELLRLQRKVHDEIARRKFGGP